MQPNSNMPVRPDLQSTLLKALGGLAPVSQGCELYIDTPTGFVFQNPDHQVFHFPLWGPACSWRLRLLL